MGCRLKLAALSPSTRNWHQEWELLSYFKKAVSIPDLSSLPAEGLESDLIIAFTEQRVIGTLLANSNEKYGLILETKSWWPKAIFDLDWSHLTKDQRVIDYGRKRLATLLIESGLVT